MMDNCFIAAKKASGQTAGLSDASRSEILEAVADRILAEGAALLDANAVDLSRMDKNNPLYDRLMLSGQRLEGIASDMRKVASLPSPLGKISLDSVLPNGLHLRRISVPYGVIGVVYEARPNVTFDVFSLCFKAGSACVLKGGADAGQTNLAAVSLIKSVLEEKGVTPDAITLLEPTHEAVAELLGAVGYVDLVIPRGGKKLIEFVRTHSAVPCIETGAGVVNTYFDADGSLEIGKAVIFNAKTRRVSVCNALDCLIVHSSRLKDLPQLVEPLSRAVTPVEILADERAYSTLEGIYPRLSRADKDTFGTEFLDYRMAVRTVDSLDEALEHIATYGSGHSEALISDNPDTAARFRLEVAAACVYVNAPTSFTDGAQFGFGAEIGISTQKLGARGPMGLSEICTYKYLIDGSGQTRP